MSKTDVDYKKVLVADVAADGGIGTAWQKIQGVVRQGTANMSGSDADTTAHKNVLGEIIRSSMTRGDNSFNYQCADISAENLQAFMGGTVTTDANGKKWEAPTINQAINKSFMVISKYDSVRYAVNVQIDAYLVDADNDLYYLQVNGLIQKPEKDGVASHGTYDEIDADSNDVLGFVLAAETGAATIDNVARTVAIEVANGTAVTALVPNITLAVGANATPNSLEAQDFTSPVVYAVENANGVSVDYTVTVTVAA